MRWLAARWQAVPVGEQLRDTDLGNSDHDGAVRLDESEERSPVLATPSQAVALHIGRRAILQMVAVGLSEALVLLATVLLLRIIIDELIVGSATASRLTVLLALLLASALVGGLVRMIEFSVTEAIGYRHVQRLRMLMYAHLQRMPPRRLLNNSRGAIVLRFTGDLTMIRTWISRGIGRGIVSVVTLLAGITVLAVLFLPFSMTAVGVLMIGGVLSFRIGSRLRRWARHVRRRRANLTTNLTEQIHSMASIQTFGRSAGEYVRLEHQNARLTQTLLRFALWRGTLRGVSAATGHLAVVGVVSVGAFGLGAGRTTIGATVAAILVVRYLMRPLRALGLAHDYWQSALVSREKITAFLNRPYREMDGVERSRLRVKRGEVEFRDVTLVGSLHGVSAKVEAKQIVAIMGPNGSGKTSLLSVVARLADPDLGAVLVDGQVLEECSLRSCVGQISMAGSMLPLLRGTVRRNLLYRWKAAPEAEIERVIALCGLRDLLDQLPLGLDSALREGGGNVASGHAARLGLARALVGSPKILLLDEPTANLDDDSKHIFRETILRYGGTVLWATHDPEEAAIADVVWRMERGRIVEVVSGSLFRQTLPEAVRVPAWARAEVGS